MSSKHGPTSKLSHLKTIREGMAKKFPLGTEAILIKGVSMTSSAIDQRLGTYIQVYTDAELAHQLLATKVESREAAEPEVDLFVEDLRVGVTPFFGPRSQELKAFGFPPKRDRKKLTGKAIVEKTEKADLTRGLRHTMGKRQKKGVKAGSAEPAASSTPTASPAPNVSPSNPSPTNGTGK